MRIGLRIASKIFSMLKIILQAIAIITNVQSQVNYVQGAERVVESKLGITIYSNVMVYTGMWGRNNSKTISHI